MNRKQFCKQLEMSGPLASQWKKESKANNYDELMTIHHNQLEIEKKAKLILLDKKPKDIEEFFGNPLSAYSFMNRIFAIPETKKINAKNLRTYIKILDKFGANNEI